MPELTNEFSWSTSRDRLFRQCRRAYYYHYYGSWGGWERDAPLEVREAYILKNLTSGRAWAGTHVHRAVSLILHSLKRGDLLPQDVVIEEALEKMRVDFKQSQKGEYRKYPKKACGLFEHEYGLEKPPSYWRALADDVAGCIRNFYASDLFEVIREIHPDTWLVVDSDEFDRERDSFIFEGERVYAKVDFAFEEDGCVYIIDWKTGRELSGNEDPLQFHTYALYGVEKWDVPFDAINLIEANLAIPASQDVLLGAEDIGSVRGYIRESIAEMKSLLKDPLSNTAEVRDFPMDEGKHCRWCNFSKLCPT